MIKKDPAILSAVVISSLMFTAAANAQVVLSDTFSYPDGPLVGAAGSPWTTNTGTAGEQNVISGELFLDDNETEDTIAPFSTAATSNVVQATFNLRDSTLDIPSSGTGDYITHFVTSGGAFFGRVFTLTSTGGPADDFLLGISTTSATPTATLATPLIAGTNYSVTVSYNFATDLASLSVAGIGSVTATDAVDTANLNRYQFRQTASTGDQFIDNLVVTIVPEPATWAMIAVGAGLLGATQRFRRKNS